MKHFASGAFWDHYQSLPNEVRQLAGRAFARLKDDPRVGISYRALAVEADDDLVWFWIGNHSEYEKLIK
ncbi:MAG: hypothetical protein ACRD1T_10910 [Acidimicrobiia bacterium]